MSRFRYVLEKPIEDRLPTVFGLFPFSTVVDSNTFDFKSGKLDFHNSAVDALKLLGGKNCSVILFVNQFKNKLSFDQFQQLNKVLENFISSHGIKVAGLYWCPSTDKNDPFVVPNPGMFNRVTENQGIDWDNIPVIATSDSDLLAAERAKATPIKIGKGSSKWTQFDSFLDWAKTI